jgi:adenylate cyclase class 2
MQYEVEMKFRLADAAAFESRLVDIGAKLSEPLTEIDVYFAHPARDFAATDEALRLRKKGRRHFITYKGPKIDPATKTRREIDLPLACDEHDFKAWFELLEALGFSTAGQVHKQRRKASGQWLGRHVEISLDEVRGLGSFVELELVVDESDIDEAKACVSSLAESLGLEGCERRSYLEMLL